MKKEKSKDKKSKKRQRGQAEIPAEGDLLLTRAMELVGGKWKLRILLALSAKETLRYGEVRDHVLGITDMMLSQSLRELCAAGLIERQQFQQIPPRVEYRLTDQAAGALSAATQLCEWAKTLEKA